MAQHVAVLSQATKLVFQMPFKILNPDILSETSFPGLRDVLNSFGYLPGYAIPA